MTDREPPGIDFGTWVEHKIREAAERGAFDDLPEAGKPIPDPDEPRDELWWIKRKLRDEGLAWLPPTIALRKEAEAALAAAARAGSEAEVRAIVTGINAKIAEGNRKAASGPPAEPGPVRPRAGGRLLARRPRGLAVAGHDVGDRPVGLR